MVEAVRLDALTEEMAGRGVPLQSETALFVALLAVEAMRVRPAVLTAEDLSIDPEGAVHVRPEAPATDDLGAMHESVVALLETLLVPPPASVLDLGARVRGGELATRGAFLAELQAMLVPLNRAAATRMLGRLVREHGRTRRPAPAPPAETPTGPTPDPAAATDSATTRGLSASDAADTVLDAPVRRDWDDDPFPAPKPSAPRWLGVVLLFVSMAALGASAMFLWSRLR